MNNPAGPPSGFDDAIAAARHNVSHNRKHLAERVGRSVVRWARFLLRFVRSPHVVEEIFVRGYEHLPLQGEHAPILAFSHKKLHDVPNVMAFMAGRPAHRFHDLTFVAQAGLYYPIYPFRDLVPDWIKRSFLRRPAVWWSSLVGRFLAYFFGMLHGYPVFRDGSDSPVTEQAYLDVAFSGPLVMKMSYPEFLKHASRTTRNSIIRVQRDLVELNRSLVIFPEGIYCHSGGVDELQDFLGVTAFRKQRATNLISLSYDELCPDRRGRIRCLTVIARAIAPPTTKEDIPQFNRRAREILQTNTPVLCSNLIALAVADRLAGGATFSKADLAQQVHDLARFIVASGYVHDPRLASPDFVDTGLARFLAGRGRRWFQTEAQGVLTPRPLELARFTEGERTASDLEWNCNTVAHIRPDLKAAGLLQSPSLK